MSLVEVDTGATDVAEANAGERSLEYCRALERGDILYFAATPIALSAGDLEFLRAQRQSGASYHKNVAYRPLTDRLTGYAGAGADRMRQVMANFSKNALACLRTVLTPYQIEPDFASFRPLEEHGRQLPLKQRNDLLHVDSFPTRPTHGRRILRFFVNIHPSMARVWRTGPPFQELARAYARTSGLLDRAQRDQGRERWLGLPERLGLPLHPRPVYDRFMLSFHHWLKANREFQTQPHDRWEFPPLSSWIVFTDLVSHAVLSGQYALEQTVFVRRESLVDPQLAPVAVLHELLHAGSAQ